jgi:hypothetical protein
MTIKMQPTQIPWVLPLQPTQPNWPEWPRCRASTQTASNWFAGINIPPFWAGIMLAVLLCLGKEVGRNGEVEIYCLSQKPPNH